jgi:ubiquinone/menaquinone biosynthesis C-methylase UbiE
LDFSGADGKTLHTGTLTCSRCKKHFPIVNGIPHFIQPEALTGLNRRFARKYDLFAWAYRAFSRIAFVYIGMDEETGRREVTDRLDPRGGRVLEVSIGPGVNLPYLVNRTDVGEIIGLDISLGQLKRCQSYAEKKGWGVDLILGNGEQLPVRDETFDGVFHVGGINFFNDKKSAIDEMIRVAKPGARILIADETEKGAQGYEKFVPGFKKSFGGKRREIIPPVDLVPSNMLETRVFDVWLGWLYCIEFRKP